MCKLLLHDGVSVFGVGSFKQMETGGACLASENIEWFWYSGIIASTFLTILASTPVCQRTVVIMRCMSLRSSPHNTSAQLINFYSS